jgi:2,4-dienoyl-CoA reductase (NADPH2)
MLINVVPLRQMKILMSLYEKGIAMLTDTTCEGVYAEGVKICRKDGQGQIIPTDTIVIATGSKPDRGLYDALQGNAVELYLIGDAVQPRSVFEAVEEGFKAGMDV